MTVASNKKPAAARVLMDGIFRFTDCVSSMRWRFYVKAGVRVKRKSGHPEKSRSPPFPKLATGRLALSGVKLVLAFLWHARRRGHLGHFGRGWRRRERYSLADL